MQVILRIDDINSFSDSKVLQVLLTPLASKKIPVVLGVVPFQSTRIILRKSLRDAGLTTDPSIAPSDTGIYPLSTNKTLVHYLKNLCQNSLIEIAQHGCYHDYTSHPEFAHTHKYELKKRLTKGEQELKKLFGKIPTTFISPWDELSTEAMQMLVTSNKIFFAKKKQIFKVYPWYLFPLLLSKYQVSRRNYLCSKRILFADYYTFGNLNKNNPHTTAAYHEERFRSALASRKKVFVLSTHLWYFVDKGKLLSENLQAYHRLISMMVESGAQFATCDQFRFP